MAGRSREDRYQKLVEAFTSAVAATDSKGCFVERQPSWEAYTGQKWDESRDAGWLQAFRPGDRKEVEKLLHSPAAFEIQVEIFHGASRMYRHCRLRGVPVRAPESDISEWILGAADVEDAFQLEQRLSEASRRLALHMENSPLAVVEWDRDYRIVRWSEGATRLFGWEPAEIVGRLIGETRIVHPEDAEEVARTLRSMSAGATPRSVLMNRNCCKDGGVVYCEWHNSTLYDEEGKMISVFSVAVDVTARVEARQRLQSINARLQSVLESTTDSVLAFGPDWRIHYLNARAEQAVGAGRNLIGMHLWEAFPEAVRSKFFSTYERVMQTRKAETVEEYYEPFQVWFESHAYPSDDGGITLFFRDVTERRQMLDALRRSEEKFRNLAESIPEIAWVSAPNGSVEYYNSRWFSYTGQSEEEAYRWGWQNAVHPEDREECVRTWLRSVESGADYDIEARIRSSSGDYRWFLGRARPLRNPEGHILNWFGICTDIQNRKEHEAALFRSNEELNRFAYVVSHDLQEPLRTITAYTQLLERRLGPAIGEEEAEYVRYIVDGGHHMQALLRDLLAYSRVSRPEESGQNARVDMNLVVEQVLGSLDQALREAGAQVESEDLPVVTGSRAHLFQLLQNLISNAAKYRRADAVVVRIGAERSGAFWRFSVRDNGIGIEPRYAEQIFGVFKRLHGRSYAGTGIGLAICQKIVERNGGRIWVESQPGEGSTFYFTWPAAQDQAADTTAS